MNKPTYTVEMSTDGNHKVVVTIEDPGGTEAALAWAQATYDRLTRGSEAKDMPAEPEVAEDVPQCSIHLQPMVRVNGKRGPFWSCHQKLSDGSWCTYRPS